jgi:23S rRNA (cytosine1962-C5)-methyltransferase
MFAAFPASVIFQDDQLLVIDKPAGIATHSPEPGVCWGWYEYFHWRNPDSEKLRLLHRLDRDTSGVLLFAKTAETSRELSQQWESEQIGKRYVFATRRKPSKASWKIEQAIGGHAALTEFRALDKAGAFYRVEARPRTGRTHQVRIHASNSGAPIVGDREHGDENDEWPLLLHATEMTCSLAGAKSVFAASLPDTFSAVSAPEAWWRRAGVFRDAMTGGLEAVRAIHGAADGFAQRVVERFGGIWVLSEFGPLKADPLRTLLKGRELVTKTYLGEGKVENKGAASPTVVSENGLRYEVRFDEATTTGLFLDQRENRLHLRRLLAGLPPGPVLNCFAHTCSFSVAAAAAGRRTASVDLSPKYLEWGKRNFTLNDLNADEHAWLRGDAKDWLKRLKKKNEKFAAIILDPPSFSRGKLGDFRVERDLQPLIRQAAELLLHRGVMLIATNFQKWSHRDFISKVTAALGKKPFKSFSLPLPPDFPYQSGEKLWMRSVWITLGA